jgi:DNA-binding transcriptional MerR regulator
VTVDELAHRAGSTTRNVRALQTSGALLRPEIVGRTARYGDAHLARLQAVLRLQGEGFSISSIRILFDALRDGQSLADVLDADFRGSARTTARPVRLLSVLPSTWLQDLEDAV